MIIQNNIKNNPKIFCVLGPTGVGKTAIVIELKKYLPIEVISVDSCLIYKNMDIGTAKPSLKDLNKCPHSLIDILDPKDFYSVNKFLFDSNIEICNIFLRNNIPLLVGGTMMYYNSLFNGLSILPKGNDNIRKYINFFLYKYGNKCVYNHLLNIDYDSVIKVHYNDIYRLTRIWEVFLITGQKLSLLKNKKKDRNFYDIKKIILFPREKDKLFLSIRKRFLCMLSEGFEEEVWNLYCRNDLNVNIPSMKCIGYREMWLYFDNKITYSDMIDISIKKTFNLVKKQLTWLKKWSDSFILEVDNIKTSVIKIINFINKSL